MGIWCEWKPFDNLKRNQKLNTKTITQGVTLFNKHYTNELQTNGCVPLNAPRSSVLIRVIIYACQSVSS